MFDVFLISTGAVALAEIGDKTQLLALMLVAKYKNKWAIILGILVATLANHALAGVLGVILEHLIEPTTLRWILGCVFLLMGIWILIPDKLEQIDNKPYSRWGVFTLTVILFFMAEMGDKTQLATVGLVAAYPSVTLVVLGTTLGMMIANVPAVLFGEKMVQKISIKTMNRLAGALFFMIAICLFLDINPNILSWLGLK